MTETSTGKPEYLDLEMNENEGKAAIAAVPHFNHGPTLRSLSLARCHRRHWSPERGACAQIGTGSKRDATHDSRQAESWDALACVGGTHRAEEWWLRFERRRAVSSLLVEGLA